MKLMFILIGTLVIVMEAESLTVCTNSHICGRNMCCRGTDRSVVTDQEMGGFGPHFSGGGHQNGTCSAHLSQKGEICDYNCNCGTGLTCYRPMSGLCCPPMRCYDAQYVHKQQAYWKKCMADPTCPLPP